MVGSHVVQLLRPWQAMRTSPLPHGSLAPVMSAVAARSDDQTDLGGLIAILKRNLGRIAFYTLAGLGLAALYLLLATPQYTAATSVFVDPRYRKIATEEVLQGSAGSDLSLIESQLAIIGSDAILRRVVEREKLTGDIEFVPPRGGSILGRIRAAVLGARERPEPTVEAMIALSRALKVKRAQRSYVLDIEVSARNPVKAARLADAVADAYLADQTGAKAAEARRANELLDGRLGELREQVRRAEIKVDEFKRQNGILVSEGGLVNEQQLTRLNGELATARAAVAEAKGRLDEVNAAIKSGAGPDALPDAVKSNLIQRLREQHATVARREAALATQLGPRHPVLIDARSQVAEVRQQIAAELRRIVVAVRSEHDAAVGREREIQRNLERLKGETGRTQTALIRLRELARELDANRDILRTFLTRATETREQQKTATPDARIITPAAVPTAPARPIAWLTLALGLMGGLGVGVLRAMMRDHLDRTVRTAGDLVEGTGLRPLVAIPMHEPKGGLGRISRGLGGARRAAPATFADLIAAVTDAEPAADGPFRQAILRLLARLRTLSRAGHPQLVLLSSGHAGAGTSGTALALASAAAQAGERTLLVDACSPNPELSLLLAADIRQDQPCILDNKDHLAAITVRDSRSGLSFLPIALADLRRLKTSQRHRLVLGITKLAQDYDLVLIDAGALLEDEAVLSLVPAVDHVLLLARAGSTERDTVADTLQSLEAYRERITGLVLTMTRPPQ